MIKKNHTREKVSGTTTYDYRKKSRVKPAPLVKNNDQQWSDTSSSQEHQDFMFQKRILDGKIDAIATNLYKSIANSQGEAIEQIMRVHKASEEE